MFAVIEGWRRRRILRRSPIGADDWRRAFERLPLLDGLNAEQCARLIELATVFLHDKHLQGVGSVVLNRDMELVIGLQACLPILALDLDWYDDWRSVLVYPDEFTVEHEEVDEAGVVHRVRRHLAGEAWHDGPVILSWNDVYHAGEIDGYNLVIHEFAHKLDMRNGQANGFPPLHPDMSPHAWTDVFSAAYGDFERRARHAGHVPFDDYAAESPGEFFAVVSEVFFEQPQLVRVHYPAVYDQLCAFYRQDPLARLPR